MVIVEGHWPRAPCCILLEYFPKLVPLRAQVMYKIYMGDSQRQRYQREVKILKLVNGLYGRLDPLKQIQ